MDGRIQRWQRNHRAIVRAALDLVADLHELPGAQAIADRAGVSKRTVFGHFPDLETLFIDAADHQQLESWSGLTRRDDGRSFEERLDVAVADRSRLFEEVGPVRRVASRLEKDHEQLLEIMDSSRRALRRHLELHLAPEIDDLDPDVREGVQAVASFEVWEMLRHQRGLDLPEATAVVTSTIRAAVAAARVKEA